MKKNYHHRNLGKSKKFFSSLKIIIPLIISLGIGHFGVANSNNNSKNEAQSIEDIIFESEETPMSLDHKLIQKSFPDTIETYNVNNMRIIYKIEKDSKNNFQRYRIK